MTSATTAAGAIPGLWGFAPLLRSLGRDLGFVPFVIGTCVIVYVLTLVASRGSIGQGGTAVVPRPQSAGAVPVRRERRRAGFRRRPMVDGAQRRVAPRGHAAHPVQHDGGAPARRRRRPSFTGPAERSSSTRPAAIAGFALSSFAGAYCPGASVSSRQRSITVGASASISGLIGALLYYGHRTGSSIVQARRRATC